MEKKLKVLFLHPFGKDCGGNWNHRLQKQAQLMSEKCDLKIVSQHTSPQDGIGSIFKAQIKDAINNFNPDVLYINGFVVAYYVIINYPKIKIVYDLGSFIGRKAIMEQAKLNYLGMELVSAKDLREIAGAGYTSRFYEMEKEVIKKVDAIICWEGKEADLLRRLYGVSDKVKEISMIVHETPEPIPFEKKRDRAMAIAAKWSDRGKNIRLLKQVEARYQIMRVGKNGGKIQFLEHSILMQELNRSKVLFCPFICGGIGIVLEALKCGCNVVAYDWYPFNAYLNKELIIDSSDKPVSMAISTIIKAMGKYYPPKKELPKANEVINSILNVCRKITIKT